MITVHVNGHDTVLHYDVEGPSDRPQVLVLHGWGSSSAVMSGLIKSLSGDYRVLSLDMPGHGLSPVSPVAWGLREQADAVRQFLEKQTSGTVTVVGHSNGGRIALYMASDSNLSQLLNGLVLFSPSGIRRSASARTRVRRMIATALKAPFMILPTKAREYGLDWLRHTFLWSLLGSSDYRALDGIMRETFVLTVNSYVEDQLGEIRLPVLVYWGENDEDIVLAQMQKLEADIPDAGIVVVKDAGHYAFLDRPDMAVEGIRHFVKSLSGEKL